MSELKPRITKNGIDYILVGDYYIPDLKLPEEHRPIGKYGRMHREYLREVHPARLNTLILTGELWTYLTDLNEQAQERLDTIMAQMKAAEGVTEELKRTHQMEWVQRCNNIHNLSLIHIFCGRIICSARSARRKREASVLRPCGAGPQKQDPRTAQSLSLIHI